MRTLLKVVFSWLVVVFLCYKYVYLQLGLLDDHVKRLIGLFFLVIGAFFLAGSETAIAHVNEGDLWEWHEQTQTERKALQAMRAHNNSLLQLVKYCGHKLRFHGCYSWKSRFWVSKETVILEQRLAMVVICNNIININMALLLATCLLHSVSFLNGSNMPHHFPVPSPVSFLDEFLPLAGEVGFSSVGVTILLLIVAELLPKALGYRFPEGFLKISTYVMLPLQWARLPGVFADGLGYPINRFIGKQQK